MTWWGGWSSWCWWWWACVTYRQDECISLPSKSKRGTMIGRNNQQEERRRKWDKTTIIIIITMVIIIKKSHDHVIQSCLLKQHAKERWHRPFYCQIMMMTTKFWVKWMKSSSSAWDMMRRRIRWEEKEHSSIWFRDKKEFISSNVSFSCVCVLWFENHEEELHVTTWIIIHFMNSTKHAMMIIIVIIITILISMIITFCSLLKEPYNKYITFFNCYSSHPHLLLIMSLSFRRKLWLWCLHTPFMFPLFLTPSLFSSLLSNDFSSFSHNKQDEVSLKHYTIITMMIIAADDWRSLQSVWGFWMTMI